MRIERRKSVGESTELGALAPVVARIYSARGVESTSDLDYSLQRLAPFHTLRGIETATDLLWNALSQQHRVVVIGDFDADGATSCAVAVLGLRALGLTDVDFLIPNRFEYGYGLTPEIVEVAAQRKPDLLITVDNGISSIDGVRAARDKGMRVLITDHHLPGAELPPADAIVNPNQPGCEFPSKTIAGVGVMFYVLLALRARLRELDWFTTEDLASPNLAELLDLVALGTVADVVGLDHNNRVLVSQGLARIRAGRCRCGIDALSAVANRDRSRLVAADLAFALAPRLNAAGRLTDMSKGVACLLAENEQDARPLAAELDALNEERRGIESEMHEQALTHLEGLRLDGGADRAYGVCLFDAAWHQGVVGILASRMKERLHRPVIAFAAESDDKLKGSGRSVAGFHIRDALQNVASANPGMIERFGGHAMAAGLTLARSRLDEFSAAFDAQAREHLDPKALEGVIVTDGPLNADDLNLGLAETIRSCGPWGQGFPEPSFDGEFEVLESRILKGRHVKLAVRVPESPQVLDAIAFNADIDRWSERVRRVRLVYRLEVNEYRGARSVNLIVVHLEPLG